MSTKKEIIELELISNIESNKFPIYSKIKNESELMEQFNVSKMTIRKSIDYLIFKGYLFAKQGHGVYVSPIWNFKNGPAFNVILEWENRVWDSSIPLVFKQFTNMIPNFDSSIYSSFVSYYHFEKSILKLKYWWVRNIAQISSVERLNSKEFATKFVRSMNDGITILKEEYFVEPNKNQQKLFKISEGTLIIKKISIYLDKFMMPVAFSITFKPLNKEQETKRYVN